MFSDNPKIGFLANANKYQAALDKGERSRIDRLAELEPAEDNSLELALAQLESDAVRAGVTGGQGGPAVSPSDAIRINGRIVRAGESLSQVRSVSQAALDYGFSDFSHFSQAFRKAFGVAPNTLLRRD